ncbi:MAG: hypothetical protein PHQ43_00820 [Dehalococcoidales bacterium]|nr:hypothetical protein [Dehalococcoidales bacterium]
MAKYTVKKKVVNGSTAWLVPSRRDPTGYGFGTTIHRSRADADWQAQHNKKLDAQDDKRGAERVAYAQEQARVKAKHDDTKGFADRYNEPTRSRVIKILRTSIRLNGVVDSRLNHITKLLAKGYKVVRVSGKRVLQSKSGSYFTEKDITKTGMDFAAYSQGRK